MDSYRFAEDTERGTTPALGIGALMQRLDVDQFDLVKLDVEGAEEEILRNGWESWLSRTRMMVVEVHNPEAEAVLAAIVDDGWRRFKWGGKRSRDTTGGGRCLRQRRVNSP